MEPTHNLDPNKTLIASSIGMKTQVMPATDPLKTMAVSVVPPGQALTAELTAGREAAMANGPAREQFLLEITAAPPTVGVGMGAGARTPLNLCLVIDRSGSMEGLPLDYVKQACAHVVDMMSPEDVLSIVTFEETVEVLMPPQRVTDKVRIKNGLMQLQPGNTTNLFDGLTLGLQQVLSLPDPGRATRLVILSDGEPTAGIKDFNALVNHAGDIKERGVTCTFLGFGPDYNEELLVSMAKRAGGNYYYIPRPEMIPEVFRTELEKLLTTVARNLLLTVKPARWVNLRAPEPSQGEEVSIQLADLERGSTLAKVLDFEFPNHPLGWYRVAAGRLTYEDLLSGKHEAMDINFVIEFSADAALYSVAPNSKVASAAQVALASKTVEKTIMGLKTGMLSATAALQELQKTQMMLTAEGRGAEAREVTLAMQAIQTGNSGSAEKTLLGTALQLDQGKSS